MKRTQHVLCEVVSGARPVCTIASLIVCARRQKGTLNLIIEKDDAHYT